MAGTATTAPSSVLLERARQLREHGEWDLAIVVAQTAFEVLAAQVVYERLEARDVGGLRAHITSHIRTYSLLDDRTQKLWHELTNDAIKQAGWWAGYRVHGSRDVRETAPRLPLFGTQSEHQIERGRQTPGRGRTGERPTGPPGAHSHDDAAVPARSRSDQSRSPSVGAWRTTVARVRRLTGRTGRSAAFGCSQTGSCVPFGWLE